MNEITWTPIIAAALICLAYWLFQELVLGPVIRRWPGMRPVIATVGLMALMLVVAILALP